MASPLKLSQDLAFALHTIVHSPSTVSEISMKLNCSRDTIGPIQSADADWDILDKSLSARPGLLKVVITLKDLFKEVTVVHAQDVEKLRARLPRLQEKGIVEIQIHS